MLKRFIKNTDGQDLVEYALLVAVVALGAVAALTALQTVISSVWTTISTDLSS